MGNTLNQHVFLQKEKKEENMSLLQTSQDIFRPVGSLLLIFLDENQNGEKTTQPPPLLLQLLQSLSKRLSARTGFATVSIASEVKNLKPDSSDGKLRCRGQEASSDGNLGDETRMLVKITV